MSRLGLGLGLRFNRKSWGLGFAGGVVGPTYYVSNTGSDANDGRSPTTAWQTIAKVNAQTWLIPNTRVLFKGNITFIGTLTPNNGLSPSSPLVFGSFNGRATITPSAAANNGFTGLNIAGYVVRDIDFAGLGAGAGTGILANNTQAGNTKLAGISFINCSVTNFGSDGLNIGGSNGSSGFTTVLVDSCAVFSNIGGGISAYGTGPLTIAHTNVTYTNCLAFSNTKNGILMGNVQNGLIHLCECYSCGASSLVGPVGIWFYDCTNSIIQFCESYNQLTGNTLDGCGFDLDGGCVNCTVQYCYSHGNKGAGFLIYTNVGLQPVTGSTIRYCISENDGSVSAAYGGITIATDGPANTGNAIYNNTIYQNLASRACIKLAPGTVTGRVANNIFFTTQATGFLIDASNLNQSGMLFTGNNYWPTGGFQIKWNNVTYTSLATWQAAFTTQEKIGAASVALNVDPLLTSAGSGGTVHGYVKGLPTAYLLQSGSPMKNAGLDLNAQFGISVGLIDYYSNTIPVGSAHSVGANDA